MNIKTSQVIEKISSGKRLSLEDGLTLYGIKDLSILSMLANRKRQQQKADNIVTYILDRNINYTNICVADCTFCAFYRKLNDEEAYVLTQKELDNKIEETIALGGIQILLQGGLNPQLKLDYYTDLFKHIKNKFPSIHLHALSPPEVLYIAKIMKMPVAEVISELRSAGLDSIPGGGAEILVEEVRKIMAPNKWHPDEWIDVMRQAHLQGMRTTATMMFGSVETVEDRLKHMLLIRKLQDETGGFTAFIPWTFQPENNRLGERVDYQKATAFEYLQTTAIARLILDNIHNIQASWVTMGAEVAQLSLKYGVNDFGSLMIEENVVREAGAANCMTEEEMKALISDMGFEPRRRNQRYELIN